MRITIKQKQITTIVSLILLALVIIFAIVLPAMRSIDQTVRTISQRAVNEDAELQRLRLLRKSLQEIDVARQDLENISGITMKSSVDEVKIDDLFKAVSAQHGISMEISYTKEAFEYPPYKERMNYTITAVGFFDQVRAFLAKVESLSYYIHFHTVDFERLPPSGNASHVKMVIKGYLFIDNVE